MKRIPANPAELLKPAEDRYGSASKFGGIAIAGAHDDAMDRMHHIHSSGNTVSKSQLEKYRQAQAGFDLVIDALTEISTPEIETKIEVLRPLHPNHYRLAMVDLLLDRGNKRGFDISDYTGGGHGANHRADRYFLTDTTAGWVLPMGSLMGMVDPIYSKRFKTSTRHGDLIIEKPGNTGSYRSWKGGVEAADGEGLAGHGKPRIIGVSGHGGEISDRNTGDHALESMLATDTTSMTSVVAKTNTLITVATSLIKYAKGDGGSDGSKYTNVPIVESLRAHGADVYGVLQSLYNPGPDPTRPASKPRTPILP